MLPVDELSVLQKRLELAEEIDQLLEIAIRTRAPLAEIVPHALQTLYAAIEPDVVLLRTRDESGAIRDWVHPPAARLDIDRVQALHDEAIDQGDAAHMGGNRVWYATRLDVSDEALGAVIAVFPGAHTPDEERALRALMENWSEQVDNYVGAVWESRRKQAALGIISDGFKHAILEDALDGAIHALSQFVGFDELVVACQSDPVLDRRSHVFRVIMDRDVRYTSAAELDPRISELVNSEIVRLLDNQAPEDVLHELRIKSQHVEDIPILGIDGYRVVGRVLLGSATPLTPFSRDLLDRFADYLRQRVVDFSREWKRLSMTFPQPVVERLIREPNYTDRFLSPREAQCAVLYTDITGFTSLSEQILREPPLIGRLVDRWSRHAVEIVWDTGGVFDKMVGDCIIAMWGPPFFDMSPLEAARAAAQAAIRIRNYTAKLGSDPEFHALANASVRLGVSTSLQYAPMYVGLFGPNESFTCFSSGMNNAARLQGLAARDEILCMDSFVEAFGDLRRFGDERTEKVKNVSDPLKFRPLIMS